MYPNIERGGAVYFPIEFVNFAPSDLLSSIKLCLMSDRLYQDGGR